MMINKRQFLRGAGGAVMAIPFLPSVMSRAFAGEPGMGAIGKCFFAIGTAHGGVWGQNMYPPDAVLSEQTDYNGHTIRHGVLPTASGAGGVVQLSPMCSAARLTPELVGKFNILRGIDVPYRMGHHNGGYLGNFGETAAGTIGGSSTVGFRVPTIDQVVAWSPSFYTAADLASRMTQRSFCLGDHGLSWNHTSPATKTGKLVPQRPYRSNGGLFSLLFDPGSTYNGVDTVIIDRVKRSYDRLRRHRRLSRGDLARLDQHVERMFEIERKLTVMGEIGAPPAPPERDTSSNAITGHHTFHHSPVLNAEYCGLLNDVIVTAFSAGVSRVGTWYQNLKFAEQIINDWHGQVAHNGLGADVAQGWTMGWNHGTFEHVMVDLAAKMHDVDMADGTTLLDNSLIMFTQEAGQVTHHTGTVNFPVVTAGGAGGAFNTGMFVDFSNQDIVYDDLAELRAGNPMINLESPGLYFQQFLGGVLRSMGLPREEYENFTDFSSGEPTAGYGVHHVDPDRAGHYQSAMAVMGDPLPVISTGG